MGLGGKEQDEQELGGMEQGLGEQGLGDKEQGVHRLACEQGRELEHEQQCCTSLRHRGCARPGEQHGAAEPQLQHMSHGACGQSDSQREHFRA